MSPRSVLISGAGVAGPTLAYWLARHGFRPTVVERAGSLRSSGSPVDVRGPALPVAEQMGIMTRLREEATQARYISVIDATGRVRARVATQRGQEIELPRGALAAALAEAARDSTEFLFDDTIVELRQDPAGVDVSFERNSPRRFDLVVGADGLHSAVRRLAFGPERDFVQHLGIYLAGTGLGEPARRPHDVVLYNTPGRMVSIHPARGEAQLGFMFYHPAVSGLDSGDSEQHKQIVRDVYAGAGWKVPQLLDRLQKAPEVYFDSVSHVRLSSWSRGRITLLGDAASCVSLFGDGSSLAIAGAYTLAAALGAEPDHTAAYRRYEAEHRRLAGPKERRVHWAAAVLVPKTGVGLAVRNLVARVLR